MTTDTTPPEQAPSSPDVTSYRLEELAEAAWWHLVNRHDLAQVLDQLTTTAGAQQLHAAAELLGNRTVRQPAMANPKPCSLCDRRPLNDRR